MPMRRRQQRLATSASAAGIFSTEASTDFRTSTTTRYTNRRSARKLWSILRTVLIAHIRLLRNVVRLQSQEEAVLRRIFAQCGAAKGTGNAREALARLGFLATDDDLALLAQHGTVVAFEDFAMVVVDKKRTFARERRQAERTNEVDGALRELFTSGERGQVHHLDRARLASTLQDFGVSADEAFPMGCDLSVPAVTHTLGLDAGDGPRRGSFNAEEDIWRTLPEQALSQRKVKNKTDAEQNEGRTLRHTIGGISFDFEELSPSAVVKNASVSFNATAKRNKSFHLGTDTLRSVTSSKHDLTPTSRQRGPTASSPHLMRTPSHRQGSTPKSFGSLSGALGVSVGPSADVSADTPPPAVTSADADAGGSTPAPLSFRLDASPDTPAHPEQGRELWGTFEDGDTDDDEDDVPPWLLPIPPSRALSAMRGDPEPKPLRPISRQQERGLVGRMQRDVDARRERAQTAERSRKKTRGFVVDGSPTVTRCLNRIESAPRKRLLPPPNAVATQRSSSALSRPPFDSRPATPASARITSRAVGVAVGSRQLANRPASESPTPGRQLMAAPAQGSLAKWLRGGGYAAKAAGALPQFKLKAAA